MVVIWISALGCLTALVARNSPVLWAKERASQTAQYRFGENPLNINCVCLREDDLVERDTPEHLMLSFPYQ